MKPFRVKEVTNAAPIEIHQSFSPLLSSCCYLVNYHKVVCAPITIQVILHRYISLAFQVFAVSVEKKSDDMKKQKRKQDALILKMLPKDVVEKLNSGADTAETFDSATLFFSTVVDFSLVTKNCKALEIVNFLNDLYNTLDDRMDQHDVYKVETISDSYLVASGLPKKNGDK